MSRFGDYFSNMGANLTEHTGQALATFAANRLLPGAGTLLNRFVFAPRNLNQTNQHLGNALSQANDRRQNSILPPGDQSRSDSGHDNTGLMNALMGSYSGQGALNNGLYNMGSQFQGANPTNSAQLINGLLPGNSQNYDNSPQAGGNLGIGPGQSGGAIAGNPQMMNGNQFGYSQAGGGFGAGVWNGGGGMHSFQVNSGSLSPSNYGGLSGGGGGGFVGPYTRPSPRQS